MQTIEMITHPSQPDSDADKWAHCDECGERIAHNNIFITADGESICESCRDSKYSLCANCGEYVNNDDIAGTYDNAPLCQSCYEDDFFTCDGCGCIERNPDAHSLNDDWLCESCYDARAITCADCGDVIENPDDAYSACGNTVCESCLNENYYRCD